MYVAVHDTTRINDTTFVVLPREVRQYADSTYRAQVSGVEPSLDWIEVYQRTTTITNYITKVQRPKWDAAVFAQASLPFRYEAGLEFRETLAGPLDVYLRTGYVWRGVGWYATGGVRLILKSDK